MRAAGAAIKDDTLAHLGDYLCQLEERVQAHGGTVHWARDATEANRIVTDLVRATGSDAVVKVKSMATQEIGLNAALAAAGISATETDLAELIVQLGHDNPSHILVPAIHRNRSEIRDIFLREMEGVDPTLTDEPASLAEAARRHLRAKFLSARVAVSGANFAIAETGTLMVVESEGDGRMCLTLPKTLITVMGIEKLIPTWRDLEVFLQLLLRSSTAERMNPYTSMWTGAVEGQDFHLVLLDNGRTAALADPRGRSALRCIRCSACLNVCPVYERTRACPSRLPCAVARLDEIPGVGTTAAAVIIAEVGVDMTRFPTAHLSSWARLAPGVKESAGRKKGAGSTGHGDRYLARILGEAAVGASKTDTFLGERYRRIARRRGKKKAVVAVGRSILIIVWYLLSDPETCYHDLGPGYYDSRINPERKKRNHIRELEALGYKVTLQPAA